MHTWEYDATTLGNDETAERWKLERQIQYGLGGEKLNADLLRKHLPMLRIPDEHRRFLALILS